MKTDPEGVAQILAAQNLFRPLQGRFGFPRLFPGALPPAIHLLPFQGNNHEATTFLAW